MMDVGPSTQVSDGRGRKVRARQVSAGRFRRLLLARRAVSQQKAGGAAHLFVCRRELREPSEARAAADVTLRPLATTGNARICWAGATRANVSTKHACCCATVTMTATCVLQWHRMSLALFEWLAARSKH